MPNYKKCPRCDLNWITEDEELCEVCKAELGIKSKIVLLEDDDSTASAFGAKLCPICGINYISEDEDMCDTCRTDMISSKRASRKAVKDASQYISGYQQETPVDPDAIDADSIDAMEEEEPDENEESYDGDEVLAQDSMGEDDEFSGPILHGYDEDETIEEEYEEEEEDDDDDDFTRPRGSIDTDDLDDMDEDLSDEDDKKTRRKKK